MLVHVQDIYAVITPEKALEVAKAEEAMGPIVEYQSNPPMFLNIQKLKDGKEMKLIRVEMSGSELIKKKNGQTNLLMQVCFHILQY